MMTKNMAKYINILFLLGSAALLLFTLESVTIYEHVLRIGRFDQDLIMLIQSHISKWNTSLMISMTQLGSPAVIILLTVLLMIFLIHLQKNAAALWSLGTLIFGAAIVNPLLKIIVARPRPSIHRLVSETGYSFPSGHAVTATLFFGSLILLASIYLKNRTVRTLAIVGSAMAIILVMLSRVYLGVHYPTDVIGGCLLGIAIDSFSGAAFILNRARLDAFFAHGVNHAASEEKVPKSQNQIKQSL